MRLWLNLRTSLSPSTGTKVIANLKIKIVNTKEKFKIMYKYIRQ